MNKADGRIPGVLRTATAFRRLVESRDWTRFAVPGLSSSTAQRLWVGKDHSSADVIDVAARAFGPDGAALAVAWIEDKLDTMDHCRKLVSVAVTG